ncbi:MAG TPA: helix-turn-helix domain-containing protein, partial [Ktedonobacterales bacterium]|nr:helix-turn-helix domain-containing protein [Ktedonobacterales bacterium]
MSTERPPTFGELLRQYRRAAGLTQGELAERAGLSRGAIDTLERGARRTPRKDTLSLLAEALALGPDDRTALTLAGRHAPAALAATHATSSALDGHNGHADAAATLPRGTVTFLVADVEDLARLLPVLGERYADMLAELHALVGAVWAAHGGHELGTQGDSIFVVFAGAAEALAAAAQAQRALAARTWPAGAQVRLRIGIHSGPALFAAGRYVGPEVHRGAHIAAASHGGQIVASQAVVEQVEQSGDALPEGTHLRDLGAHRLPGLARRERLAQLVLPAVPGLPATFPPLRTEDAWPWLRANLALGSVLTLILVALAGLLLPLVVPTFPRAIGRVAGGAALALLVVGGVAALVWQRAQAPGTPWSQVLTHSLAALWRTTKLSGPAMLSVLLSATLVGTTLYVTRSSPSTLPALGGYDFSYTYHKPTHTGGSSVIWTTSPIHTLTTPALNADLPDEVYHAVWDACLVRLPDLKLPSLQGWKADQCTRVPTVANGDEDPFFLKTIFHVDPRATWSDGQPVTADDFLFALRLIQDPNVFGAMAPYPPDPINPPWTLMHLSKLDPYALRIDWSAPYFDYLTAL